MNEHLENAIVESKNNNGTEISILIRLLLSEKLKGLKTGILYERNSSECLLKKDDSVDTFVYSDGSPTKVSSKECAKECRFGGQIKVGQTKFCKIYKRI